MLPPRAAAPQPERSDVHGIQCSPPAGLGGVRSRRSSRHRHLHGPGPVAAAPRQDLRRPASPAQRTTPRESEARPLRVLFLGSEKAPHSSATVFGPLSSTLARRGIQLIYVPTAAEAFAAGRLRALRRADGLRRSDVHRRAAEGARGVRGRRQGRARDSQSVARRPGRIGAGCRRAARRLPSPRRSSRRRIRS